jgi:protein SCO1/2
MDRHQAATFHVLRPSCRVVRRSRYLTPLLLICLAVSCTRAREFPLKGQVLAVNVDTSELAVKHEDIPGLMPAMTMTFKVADRRVLFERVPGDLIEATLVLTQRESRLRDVRKVGFSTLAPPAVSAAATSGFELLKPGDALPDESFVDEHGRARRLSDWRGRVVAITFIYTRCPIPTFCPLMDRHFASIQATIRSDRSLEGRVHLLSVTFDPAYDTPEVLEAHARKVGAHPATWSFLTGGRDEIDRFAARLGVSVVREENPADITHNLRTAVVDAEGRIERVFTGNDWTPAQVVSTIRDALEQAGGKSSPDQRR